MTVYKFLLLILSYCVIAYYDIRFCLCMLVVTVVTFWGALGIESSGNRKRKIYTSLIVIFCIAFLGVFKYLNFFMDSIYWVIGKKWDAISIILPVGISFYIFGAISYVLDVSWGTMAAEKSFLDYALYMSFFPKLICGPIARAKSFLPQLKEKERRISWKNIEAGSQIFLFGAIKKMVFADRIGLFVDEVFRVPSAFSGWTVLWAAISYSLQLYFDFSGYSDMAIGISKMLGFDIERNFNLPFVAQNAQEYWKRWHMTLTNWLTDYVYTPLGMSMKRYMMKLPKNKRKRWKNIPGYIAVFITFLVSGIWHGAGMKFILYGFCWGVISVLEEIIRNHRKKRAGSWRILFNCLFVVIVNVLFRADSINAARAVYVRILTGGEGINYLAIWPMAALVIFVVAMVVAVYRSKKKGFSQIEGFYPLFNLTTFRGMLVYLVAAGMLFCMAYTGETYFIYGQF